MADSGTSSGPELLVELDRGSKAPLHRQLADGLRDAIRSGRLAPASRMPSTRVLSADLGVSRRLVVEAYGQLTAEGFLHSSQGGSTRVAAVDAAPPAASVRTAPAPASTSTSRRAHRISPAFRVRPGYGPCARAWPRSNPAHSATSHPMDCLRPGRGGRLPAPYPRRGRRPTPHRVVLGRNAGRRAARPVPGRADRSRESRILVAPDDLAPQRRRTGPDPGGRQRYRRRCTGRRQCRRGADHPGPPIADRGGALGRAAHYSNGPSPDG